MFRKFLPLFIFFCLVFNCDLWSQRIIVADTIHLPISQTNPNLQLYTKLRYIDLETCMDTFVYDRPLQIHFGGLAYSPEGELQVHNYRPLGASQDILSGPFVYFPAMPEFGVLSAFSTIDYPNDFEDSDEIQAMMFDREGQLYLGGTKLYRGISTDPSQNDLGDFPPEMQAKGDFFFHEDELYMSTISHTIVKVDVTDPMNSEVWMTIPDTVLSINAFVTIPHSCDSIDIIAIGSDDDTYSILYDFDVENQTFTEICQFNRPITAGAYTWESAIPPCDIYVDLDMDNNASTNEIYSDTSCISPISIADDDVLVNSPELIDSITISLTGVLDNGMEYLDSDNLMSPDYLIDGEGTPNVVIRNLNDNSTTPEEFADLIQGFQYFNDASDPTYGMREVRFKIYARFYESEVAISQLSLSNISLQIEESIDSISCFDAEDGMVSLSAVGGFEPYQFLWDDGTTVEMKDDLGPGDYFLTVTDDRGCESYDTISLNNPELLEAEIVAEQDSICGNNGSLEAIISGGIGPYFILWDEGSETPTLNNLSPGTYSVSITDQNDCEQSTEYSLFQSDTIYSSESVMLCEAESFEYEGVLYDADTSINFYFTTALNCDSIHQIELTFLDTALVFQDVAICSGEVYTVNGMTYDQDTTFAYTLTGSTGCDSTVVVALEVEEANGFLDATICEGDTYSFDGQSLTNAGVYTQTIEVPGQCDSTVILDLTVVPSPDPIIEVDGDLCAGDNPTLSVGPFATVLWSDGSTAQELIVEEAGTYSVTVTDSNDCVGVGSIELTDSNISFVFSAQDPACPGDANGQISIDTVLNGAGPFVFSINGGPFQALSNFDNLDAGTYEIIVEDVAGCRAAETIQLLAANPFTIDLGPDQFLKLGDSLVLGPLGNPAVAQAIWQPAQFLNCDSCLEVIARPFVTTTFELIATNENGCTASDDITITVDNRTGIFVPNAFSPNDDGFNDYFNLFADNSVQKINSFQIFDRWGNQVFSDDSIAPNSHNQGWDGTVRGQEAPTGVYIYMIEIQKASNEIEVISGEVVLLR
jgi:gliding motility-associated-like protein